MSKIRVYPSLLLSTFPNFVLVRRYFWSLFFLLERCPQERKSTNSREERKNEHAKHPWTAAHAFPAGASSSNSDSHRNLALIRRDARSLGAATVQSPDDHHGYRWQPAPRGADCRQIRRPRTVESHCE